MNEQTKLRHAIIVTHQNYKDQTDRDKLDHLIKQWHFYNALLGKVESNDAGYRMCQEIYVDLINQLTE